MGVFPLFGLTELANLAPNNPTLEAAIGNRTVQYLHLYTPMVKALQERVTTGGAAVPSHVPPRKGYVSRRSKFQSVWREVNHERTRHELLEACRPNVPFDARLEVVVTDDDVSFMSCFDHQAIARAVLVDRLLVKVGTTFQYLVLI